MINKIRTEKLKTSVKDYVAKSFTQKITLYTTLKINWDSSLGSFYTFVPESVSSEKLKQKLIFFNHEVYYLFDTKDKKENIKKAIKLTSSYYPMGMGIIFHIEDIKYYLTQQEIQKEEFFNVAIGNLQFLFIQAYDNESYIFWKNEKS